MRQTTFRLPTVLVGSLATTAVLALGACGTSTDDAADPTSPGTSLSQTPTDPATASAPTAPVSATTSSSSTATPSSSAPVEPVAAGTVEVYYVGPGQVLYPYPAAVDAEPENLLAALAATPQDPDYSTAWAGGQITALSISGKVATVDLSPDATGGAPAEGKLAVQQLAWTLKAAAGVSSVQFRVDGAPAATVLGSKVTSPEKARNATKFLSQATISAPLEGAEVSGSFTATGTSNGPEAWLGWQLLDADGSVVKDGFTTAEGWMDKLYPWQAKIKLTGVPAGTYTFRAYIDDPSGGEGKAPAEDTRTIVVK